MDELLKFMLISLGVPAEELQKLMAEPTKTDVVTLSFGSFLVDSCYVCENRYDTVVAPCTKTGEITGDVIHVHKEITPEGMIAHHDTLVADLMPVIKAYIIAGKET